MHDFHTMTVREIALEMPVTTRVFQELHIDYCCHGNTMFDDACESVNMSPDLVATKIQSVLDERGNSDMERLKSVSLSELIDHIVEKHHTYTREEMVQLTPLMAKVASRHGEHYAYLLELKDLFARLCDELTPHLTKEEMVLFPYIKRIEVNCRTQIVGSPPPFGTIANPIGRMTVEHEQAGEILAEMRRVTNDYELPDNACPSFTALFNRLAELEADLHQHIHLENNLLFPKAAKLEEKSSVQTPNYN